MIHLDYRDVRPIYAQIITNIKEQITAGILHTGDRLPSVRELASQLTINPNTIQRAYRELEAAGLIATAAGKGCFVCGNLDAVPSHWQAFDKAAAQLLRQGVTLQELIDHLQQGGM